MTSLTLDIGNTRTKLGLFREKKLLERLVWTDWTVADVLDYGNRAGVERVMLCSVAEPDADLAEQLRARWPTWELTHETPLPFVNAYQTPHTLGKDRLAAVAGAQALWPGEHCMVVDCGTCIKYELLSADGIYHGGNIAPGLQMRIRAMHEFTARLPEVSVEMPLDPVGRSTETALQNGALRGAVLEIEGFAQKFRHSTGPLRTVLTGGDADFLKLHLNIPNLTLQNDLTLFGLNYILGCQLSVVGE